MRRQKTTWLMILWISAWLVAACGSGTQPTPAANKASPALAANTSHADPPVALAYNPTDGSLLRGDGQGLFRWQAKGSWQPVALPQSVPVSGVVINPDHPATFYASGPGLGVVRSDDGGATWQAVNTGLPSLVVTGLALHSFQRDTLYAWLKGDGIYRTEDGGAHWVQLPDQGPPDKDVRGLVHSTLKGSMNTGWLYASTPTGGYLSMDCF
jgi:photosystem II stability/assembly factor-like uncharacterized protein